MRNLVWPECNEDLCFAVPQMSRQLAAANKVLLYSGNGSEYSEQAILQLMLPQLPALQGLQFHYMYRCEVYMLHGCRLYVVALGAKSRVRLVFLGFGRKERLDSSRRRPCFRLTRSPSFPLSAGRSSTRRRPRGNATRLSQIGHCRHDLVPDMQRELPENVVVDVIHAARHYAHGESPRCLLRDR